MLSPPRPLSGLDKMPIKWYREVKEILFEKNESEETELTIVVYEKGQPCCHKHRLYVCTIIKLIDKMLTLSYLGSNHFDQRGG